MMRSIRYAILGLALVTTLTASAVPQREPDNPPVLKRFVRMIRHVIQPLGDLISPPHP